MTTTEKTDKFDQLILFVKRKFDELSSCPICKVSELISALPTTSKKAGIYLFLESGRPLYVGRTNNLRQRLQFHTRDNHNQATFAFLLARHKTGKLNASYQPKGSRKDLLRNATFHEAFDEARERIKRMDVKYIEVEDPIKQAILEVYAAFQTNAKYNSFQNS